MKFSGFNGQEQRKIVFRTLVTKAAIEAIIETGTCNGETAGWLWELTDGKIPVTTCENNPHWQEVAKEHLTDTGVHVFNGDSRGYLQIATETNLRTFFYLDAHWGPELPLVEELEHIASRWKEFVILIDDFQHPSDEGYGFDDYGPHKTINLWLIAKVLADHSLIPFFPVASSKEETGAKRGSCWIGSRGAMEALLTACPLLTSSVASPSSSEVG